MGLPLMGSGDWNEEMNRVGHLGKGESVWLGWFLFTTLAGFIPFCKLRQQGARASLYRLHMDALKNALEETPGTVIGIDALFLTTAHLWVRFKTRSAGSIPSRNRGVLFREPQKTIEHNARWPPLRST